MKEAGMLFSTDLVRAIIDDRKTQTRRLIKKFPVSGYKWAGCVTDSTDRKKIGNIAIVPTEDDIWDHQRAIYAKPPVSPGDRIYVRETFAMVNPVQVNKTRCRKDEVATAGISPGCGMPDCKYVVIYKTDGSYPSVSACKEYPYRKIAVGVHGDDFIEKGDEWEPSMHMCKEYARIWLEVDYVAAQKISDITNDNAVKEGFADRDSFLSYMINKYGDDVIDSWCWVIDFKRVEH
jgi:hypothetical protein